MVNVSFPVQNREQASSSLVCSLLSCVRLTDAKAEEATTTNEARLYKYETTSLNTLESSDSSQHSDPNILNETQLLFEDSQKRKPTRGAHGLLGLKPNQAPAAWCIQSRVLGIPFSTTFHMFLMVKVGLHRKRAVWYGRQCIPSLAQGWQGLTSVQPGVIVRMTCFVLAPLLTRKEAVASISTLKAVKPDDFAVFAMHGRFGGGTSATLWTQAARIARAVEDGVEHRMNGVPAPAHAGVSDVWCGQGCEASITQMIHKMNAKQARNAHKEHQDNYERVGSTVGGVAMVDGRLATSDCVSAKHKGGKHPLRSADEGDPRVHYIQLSYHLQW
jgi:hypothetical protein